MWHFFKTGADIIEYKIKLSEYLSGNCPYSGCEWNDFSGNCLCEDEEFLSNIELLIEEDGVNSNPSISCSLNVEVGYCVYCGNKLNEIHERHPYGDGYAVEVLYECPNKC